MRKPAPSHARSELAFVRSRTESAVRIKHLPTGLTANAQSNRSQHQNRRASLRILAAKLKQQRTDEARKACVSARGQAIHHSNWGHQVRSITLHPYRMAKDHRTGVESTDVESILDRGELDVFLEAAIESRAQV